MRSLFPQCGIDIPLVQANFFVYGDMVIGIAILDKVADASINSKFFKSWAAIALGSNTTSDIVPASEFDALKTKTASSTVPNPTRVEVVSALIWKSAMEESKSKLSFVRASIWCQIVNMRNIYIGSAFDRRCIGKCSWLFCSKDRRSDEDHDHIQNLVAKLRKAFEEFNVHYAKGIRGMMYFNSLWNLLSASKMRIWTVIVTQVGASFLSC